MIRFRFRSTPSEDENANRLAADRDMNPEQARRMRVHNRLSNDGLDANRLSAVAWAVQHGRIGEDDQPTPEMLERAIRIPLERPR